MTPFRTILILLIVISSLSARSQIVLNGYTCKFYENQWPYTMGELCSKDDTFRFTLYSRDIADEVGDGNAEQELKVGLELCFSGGHDYTKTKDDLYFQTGQNPVTRSYYYMVYIPEKMVSLSVRSAHNDARLLERSDWLLSQIKAARKNKKDMLFVNEENQTCQDPNHPGK